MPLPSRPADESFDRFQTLLLEMRTGDVLVIGDAARLTGLSEDACRKALEALARVGLMSRETDGRFIRRSLDTLAR